METQTDIGYYPQLQTRDLLARLSKAEESLKVNWIEKYNDIGLYHDPYTTIFVPQIANTDIANVFLQISDDAIAQNKKIKSQYENKPSEWGTDPNHNRAYLKNMIISEYALGRYAITVSSDNNEDPKKPIFEPTYIGKEANDRFMNLTNLNKYKDLKLQYRMKKAMEYGLETMEEIPMGARENQKESFRKNALDVAKAYADLLDCFTARDKQAIRDNARYLGGIAWVNNTLVEKISRHINDIIK